MIKKPVKAASKRASSSKRASKRREIAHRHIAERAYYIYLEEGRDDQFGNWIRAEQELSAA